MSDVENTDLDVSIYPQRSTGGQQCGTPRGIMVVHIPTGIGVVINDERSQIKNRAKAIRMLRVLLAMEHP